MNRTAADCEANEAQVQAHDTGHDASQTEGPRGKANRQTMTTPVKDISLSRLKPSPENARKTGAEAGIDELAASIAAHGLIQPLVVKAEMNGDEETGWYFVTAGERRRKALKLLAKRKRVGKNEPIPCLVRVDGNSTEISLAENVIRTNMHPADQFEAFHGLHRDGLGPEEISARFGVTPAVVRQRLKLAAVSPRLMALYRDGEVTLDQLMAFTLTDDHQRQEETWEQLAWNKSPEMIRKLLTQSHVSPTDRRVQFVGAEAYQAAGGTILRDLFAENHGGYFTDSGLVDRLVLEKLEAAAGEVMREGWKWVEVYPEYPYSYTQALRRVHPHPVLLSEEDQGKLDELTLRYHELESQEGEDVPEEVAAELEEIAQQMVALQERSEGYLPEDVSRAGAIVSLSPDGTLRVECGLVKPEDEPQEPDGGETATDAASDSPRGLAEPSVPDGPNAETVHSLPNRLVENLTAQRTMALQECLAAKPDVALSAVAHALALRIFYRQEFNRGTCLGLEAKLAELNSFAPDIEESRAGQALARRHEEWAGRLPAESAGLWDWIALQDAETRLALLAYCAARTVDVVQRSWEQRSRAQHHADELGRAVALDMAAWWAVTRESYLAHVPKALILEAVRQGVSEREADGLAGLKKEAMIEHAERLLAGRGWLPEVLRSEGGAMPAERSA